MDARVEKVENGEAFLEIEVSAEKFEEGMEHAYRKVVKQVTVPGFRKGRVPRQLLESYYGKEVLYQDAIEYVVPGAYDEAVQSLELEVMGQPEFDFDLDALEEGKPFILKASVAVEPEVVLGEIEGLEINIPEITINDELVEKRLEDMRSTYSQMVDKTDAPSEMGDTLTIDFEGFIDGVPFEGGKGEDYQLSLGSNTFIPGFEEQLTGLKTGDAKDVEVTFPEDYNEEFAGKEAVFKVEVKNVQTKQTRELNDEFAQEVSECDTLEELRADIRKNMEQAYEKQRKEIIKQQALDKAAELCNIPLAPSAIEANARSMIQMFEQRLAAQGLQLDQYLQMTNSTVENLIENFKPDAERDLKNTYMLRKIVSEKGIEVTDEEIDKYMSNSAQETGLEEAEIRKNLETMMDVVEKHIKMDKAADYLIDHAQIKTVEPAAEQDEAAEDIVEEIESEE